MEEKLMSKLESPRPPGLVTGIPRLLLKAEGLAIFAAATSAYAMLDGRWWIFAIVLLLPDISMIGYLKGPRVGAVIYNIGHIYIVPLAVVAAATIWEINQAIPIALIWIAHIGLDRFFGYGLKYAIAFKATHLSSVMVPEPL